MPIPRQPGTPKDYANPPIPEREAKSRAAYKQKEADEETASKPLIINGAVNVGHSRTPAQKESNQISRNQQHSKSLKGGDSSGKQIIKKPGTGQMKRRQDGSYETPVPPGIKGA